MSRSVPDAAATAISSAPRAAAGWGATRQTAMRTEVMNRTRVWVARALRLRDASSVSLLTDSATNNRPVSAPATAAGAAPELAHGTVEYPIGRLPHVCGRTAS